MLSDLWLELRPDISLLEQRLEAVIQVSRRIGILIDASFKCTLRRLAMYAVFLHPADPNTWNDPDLNHTQFNDDALNEAVVPIGLL